MKQNNKLVCFVILFTIIISTISINASIAKINQDNDDIYTLSPGFAPNNVDHAIYFGDSFNSANYSTLLSAWSSALGIQDPSLSTISSTTLANNEAVAIFGHENTNYSDNEISALRSYIDQGKGIAATAIIIVTTAISPQRVRNT